MGKPVRNCAQISNGLLEPIFKLKGVAELFYTEATDGLMLSEKARNGIFFTLSGISDELQSLKDDVETSEANEG